MSDEVSNGHKTVACREVTLGAGALEMAAQAYARNRYQDCDHLISITDDGYGGKILLFTNKEHSATGRPEDSV
jgi:hypothetical protein